MFLCQWFFFFPHLQSLTCYVSPSQQTNFSLQFYCSFLLWFISTVYPWSEPRLCSFIIWDLSLGSEGAQSWGRGRLCCHIQHYRHLLASTPSDCYLLSFLLLLCYHRAEINFKDTETTSIERLSNRLTKDANTCG